MKNKPLPTFDSILLKPSKPAAPPDPDAPLDAKSARELTFQIKDKLESAYELVLLAHRKEIWKVYGLPSWSEYVRVHLPISRGHAYRLLEHAQTVELLSPTGDKPESERQTRPMKGLPDKAKKTAWKEAQKIAGNAQPTSAQVAQAVEKIKPAKARTVEPPERVETGSVTFLAIPEPIVDEDEIDIVEDVPGLNGCPLEKKPCPHCHGTGFLP